LTQQNKTGIQLRQALSSRKKDGLWFAQILVSALSAVVSSLAFAALAGIKSGVVPPVMVVVAVWLCLIYGILMKSEHEGWTYMGVLALIFVLILVCRQQVLEGFRIFWNQASNSMLKGTGWVMPEWELQLTATHKALSATLFAGIISAVLSLLSCALISFAPRVLSVLLPACLLFGMSVFGADISFGWLLPVLFTAIVIMLYSAWRETGSVSPMILSLGVCGILVCLLIAATYLPSVQKLTCITHDNVHELIHNAKYETKYSSLPEGDFSDYKNTEAEAAPALSVTMEMPQTMYLRGFTGDVFTGESWESLDKEALVKNKQLLYWLNLDAFNLNSQFDAAGAYAQIEKSTVSVKNTGACSYYRYVPFNISKGDWSQSENLNTDGVHGEGEREYLYSVVGGSGESITHVLNHLQSSDNEAVLQYRKAESGYRQFVYHYYLQIPEDVKELMSEQWDETSASYGGANNLTSQQAQDCTLHFLSRCFPKEGPPEDIKLPLEIADGTTFQYATTATMTLRYFGIPARYAEGYVISEEMAASAASGAAIEVDSSCARAWVEVYQDGIGWLPMDLTYGMGEILESPDKSDSEDGIGESKKKTQKKEEEKPEKEEQPAPVGGTMVRVIMESALKGVLKVLLILALICLVLWVRRKTLLDRKRKKFESEDHSDAAAWLYADAALFMEKLGFDRGNGSMRGLKAPIEEKYGAEFAQQFEFASKLNERAMFSSEILSEEERHFVAEFRRNVLEKLNSEEKWYKRVWFMWGLCLY